MENQILSVGIDIGTTTTQIVFSSIYIQNTASAFLVPEVKITDKKIIYKSDIYFTPLISRDKINLEIIKQIISSEYEKAKIDKKDISTGAIIITGETARKENAEEVLSALSDFAGEFVVATAGADLEAILAGYGAGASSASKACTSKVVNFDIGGGTTNAAVFFDGEIVDAFALHIGGRLIQLDKNGVIIYISEKITQLISSLNLNLSVGVKATFEDLKQLTDTFANLFLKIINKYPIDKELEKLFIQHKHKDIDSELVMFSGGVAEFIYNTCEINSLEALSEFNDIGPLLGYSIRKKFEALKVRLIEPKEKIRATVIGAGSHSLKLSGSTIVFDDDVLPIKNLPIVKLHSSEENMDILYTSICEKLKPYEETNAAIAFKGPKSPSYVQIKSMADSIVEAFKGSAEPIIIIVENDFAKALGQSLKIILRGSKKVICIDKIKVDNGDYVDIGKSISNVIPVVIKTLIFRN